MSGTDLLIIGRQAPTGFGGLIDLLALDAEGRVHVLELKPDRTPRDVVAQALDYGSWANAVFFGHFADGGCEYLARTQLLDPHQVEDEAARPSRRKRRPWNGRDFYVILGRADDGAERWAMASKYGLLNAGGGSWYWKPLRNLVPGNRVFAYVSGASYVGIGRITGRMIPARDAKVEITGQRQWLVDQPEPSIGYNGSRSAVESAFSRLAAAGDILRIRKGLYWKGATTSLGMSPPRVEEVALQLGGPGSGPAGVAAAQWLGLTSQVPSTFLAAVPGRVPSPCPGVRFTQRPIDRLLQSLTPAEVAVLEVLRAGPAVLETPWEELPDVIAGLAASGSVRLDALDEGAATEPHRQARARWSEIRANPALSPPP